jgi:hypothetical protein
VGGTKKEILKPREMREKKSVLKEDKNQEQRERLSFFLRFKGKAEENCSVINARRHEEKERSLHACNTFQGIPIPQNIEGGKDSHISR